MSSRGRACFPRTGTDSNKAVQDPKLTAQEENYCGRQKMSIHTHQRGYSPDVMPLQNSSSLIHQKTTVSWVEMDMAPDSGLETLPGPCCVLGQDVMTGDVLDSGCCRDLRFENSDRVKVLMSPETWQHER